jgi:hypothetical protein
MEFCKTTIPVLVMVVLSLHETCYTLSIMIILHWTN